MPAEKTQPFCPCSRVLYWTGKGLNDSESLYQVLDYYIILTLIATFVSAAPELAKFLALPSNTSPNAPLPRNFVRVI